ncbi:hypothetical protein ASD53_08580 [Lysobacter sp. Root559]|nr:hypothetical protein ASD53_08580 [Lysobacter sp. Root559]
MVLSPKFQLRETMLPSLSVDESVNATVRPLAEEVKLATGATLAPGSARNAAIAALVCTSTRWLWLRLVVPMATPL